MDRERTLTAIRCGARTSALAVLLAVLTLCAAAARAQDTALPLTLVANSPLSIAVPAAGGRYELVFLPKLSPEPASSRQPPKPAKITFYATPFVGAQQGDSIPVEIALPDNPARAAAARQKDVALTGDALTALLQIPPLPNQGAYAGNLIATAPGKTPMVIAISLNRATIARPATLVVDPQTISGEIVRPLSEGESWLDQAMRCLFPYSSLWGGTAFTLTLRDKSGQFPLEGVYAEVDSIAKAPGGMFSIGRNFSLSLNGVPMGAGSPAGGAAPIIAAGSYATVEMRLHDLASGSYDAIVRFRAANSGDDDGQKFHLVLDVSDPWIDALTAIMVALALSFAGTKILVFRRKSIEYEQRITALRKSRARSLREDSVPAVFAGAILSQCEEFSRHFWLSGANVIDDWLTKVTALLDVLDTAYGLIDRMDHLSISDFARIRAKAGLRRVIDGIGDDCMNNQIVNDAKKALEQFVNWTQPNSIDAAYWTDLVPWAKAAISPIQSAVVTKPTAKKVIDELLPKVTATLSAANPPPGMDAKVEVEKNCVYLKLLWERRDRTELEDLAGKIDAKRPWDEIMAIADNAIWDSIKKADHQGAIKIPDPASPYKAYEPIRLRVTTSDDYLDNTVLFKHLLMFEWKITIPRDGRDWRWSAPHSWLGAPRRSETLSPHTTQPQVFQYSPLPGKLTPTVTIRKRGGGEIMVNRDSIAIGKSADFAWQRAFAATEMFAFVMASIAAIVTGLAAFYANKTSFGAFSDYLAIMVWGLSVDQTKAAVLNYYGVAKS
jgi:hypothetical protein